MFLPRTMRMYPDSPQVAPQLFLKAGGLKVIAHWGPNSYYLALMRLSDVSVFAQLSKKRVEQLTEAQVKQLLKDGNLEAKELAEREKDPEEDPDFGEDFGKALKALGDAPAPVAGAPEAVDEALTVHIESKIVGMPRVRVGIDNYSHQSRQRRGWVTCSKHTGCRKWIFLKDFVDLQEAQAYLIAWAHDASLFPYTWQDDSHKAHVPSKNLVKQGFRYLA